MQTFLPHSRFDLSAAVLDYRRLGKQRVEVLQILKALNGETKKGAWKNHPASQMWANHIDALVVYGLAICDEWINRGYKDTCYGKIRVYSSLSDEDLWSAPRPAWLAEERLFSSHRSNLLRKDWEFYSRFGWEEDSSQEYYWPGPAEGNM